MFSPESAPRPKIVRVLVYDPEEMARRGRLGGIAAHAARNPREATAPARQAFLARFAAADDPDAARRAYFAALGRLSAEARARRREATSTTGGAR